MLLTKKLLERLVKANSMGKINKFKVEESSDRALTPGLAI